MRRLIWLMIYVMAFVFAWAFFSMLLFIVDTFFVCLALSECRDLSGVPFSVLPIAVISGLAVVIVVLLLDDGEEDQ